MPIYNADPGELENNAPTEETVECKSCGKSHNPIRVFQSEHGWYVCSWGCLADELWVLIYGYPCPPEKLKHIRENEVAYWSAYYDLP